MKETTLISAYGPDITHYPKVKMPPSNRHGLVHRLRGKIDLGLKKKR